LPCTLDYGESLKDGGVVALSAHPLRRYQNANSFVIRGLFFGFGPGTPASKRWDALSRRKLAELDMAMSRIRTMRGLLQKMARRCHCGTLEECGGNCEVRKRVSLTAG